MTSVAPGLPAVDVPRYAGFGPRLLALIIDGLILTLLTGIYAALVGGSVAATLFALAVALNGLTPEVRGVAALGAGLALLAVVVGGTVLHVTYWVLFTGLAGRTPGKMAVGLRVVDATGARPGIARAAMRELVGKFLAGLPLWLGFIWAGFDGRHQGWHDKIADTYVIHTQ